MVARVTNIASARVLKRAQQFNAKSKSVPAPIGGWNARDSIADMPAEDAVRLINWNPSNTDVGVRGGFSQYATGLGSQVETLMVYNGPSSSKMFAAAGTVFKDVSSSGAVGASVVTGLTNARFQYVNVSTSGGAFMMSVNGADKLQGYDGTNWYVDGDASHDITGVDTATVIDINLHNERVWLIEENSLKAWYLPTKAISGAATLFDLRGIARWGGSLVSMGTWTIDAGYGLNDQAVFVTNRGEVIVYIGTDPSSTSTWAKIGQFQMGAPIGNRPFTKWGGDLVLINYDGLTPLAQGLQSSRLDPRVNLTDKIRGAMATATKDYGDKFGWQVMDYPKGSLLILNVPVTVTAQEQYIMNTVTKSWWQCQGFFANCWALYNDEPYFGSNGYVGKAFTGLADANANISTTAVQAFNYFGSNDNKRWTMMRPVLQTNGSPSISAGINVDFNINPPNGTLSFTTPSYAVWDASTSTWDSATWGGGLQVSQTWTGVNGIGRCAGATLQTASNGIELRWTATDFVFEKGWMV